MILKNSSFAMVHISTVRDFLESSPDNITSQLNKYRPEPLKKIIFKLYSLRFYFGINLTLIRSNLIFFKLAHLNMQYTAVLHIHNLDSSLLDREVCVTYIINPTYPPPPPSRYDSCRHAIGPEIES